MMEVSQPNESHKQTRIGLPPADEDSLIAPGSNILVQI